MGASIFRGTPNAWRNDTLMARRPGDGFYETTQTFGTNEPRFKVDRFGDWRENKPALDFLINQGPGSYLITFNDLDTNVITEITAFKNGVYNSVVNIQVQCDRGNTVVGQSVYVLGDNPEWGSNNAADAKILSSRTFPSWRRVFTIQFGRVVRWRCIWRLENDPSNVIQETQTMQFTATTNTTVFASFN